MLKNIVRVILFLNIILAPKAIAQDKQYSLEECVKLAQQNNINIQNATLNNSINDINVKQSKQGRYPTLNANVGQGFQFGRSIDPSTNQFLQQNIVSNNVGLSSNINLFNGFQQTNSIKQNKLNLEASNYDLEKIKNDVLLSITSSYLRVVLSKEVLANTKLQRDNTLNQLQRTQLRLKAGVETQLSVLQLEAQLANENANITRSENDLKLAKVSLMQLMNIKIDDNFDVLRIDIEEPSELSEVINLDEISSIASSTQPQIKSSERRISSAEMGVKIAQSGYMPRLSMGVNISSFYSSANRLPVFTGLQTETIGFLMNDPAQLVNTVRPNIAFNNYPFMQQIKDKFGEQIFFSLTIPIVNGRQVKSSVERSTINTQITKNNKTLVENQLRQNIELAYTDYKVAIKNYQAVKESVRLSELTYDNAQKRFDAGLMNATELLIQKNNLAIAQVQLTQSKYDCFFKQKLLQFYEGKWKY